VTAAYILLGVFILFAYTAEAVTGFGSIVIALSLGALLFPIDWLQTILVPLSIAMTGWMSWRLRRHIDAALLLRLVMPFMLAGTLLGVVLQPLLAGALLKLLFAALILWFALRELVRMARSATTARRPVWLNRLLVLGAGVTHGLFASGGPLLVYALAGTPLDKARFRASLILVWCLLNSTLTLVFLWQGKLAGKLDVLLCYLPLIPVGILLGEWLHRRVDEVQFRLWVYRLLVVAALALMLATVLSWRATLVPAV
jgi:hypothetical protein